MNNKKQPTNQSENTLTEIFKYEVKEGGGITQKITFKHSHGTFQFTCKQIIVGIGYCILDVGMFSSIQSQVFDKRCVACHGQTGSASGNLFLT